MHGTEAHPRVSVPRGRICGLRQTSSLVGGAQSVMQSRDVPLGCDGRGLCRKAPEELGSFAITRHRAQEKYAARKYLPVRPAHHNNRTRREGMPPRTLPI